MNALCAVPIADGRHLLASASDDRTVRLWDPATGQTLHTLTGHTDWVRALCAVPITGGRHLLASASDDRTVRLWDLATGQTLHTLTGHTDSVNALCAVPIAAAGTYSPPPATTGRSDCGTRPPGKPCTPSPATPTR